MSPKSTIDTLLHRYGGASVDMLNRVLTPYRLKISRLWDEEVEVKVKKKKGATKTNTRKTMVPYFEAEVPADVWTLFEVGTTGKVVPRNHVENEAPWKELIKGRILTSTEKKVQGELYFDQSRIKAALKLVAVGDYLEIDPFGISSAVSSALNEAAFFKLASNKGFKVTRMPANVAMDVGTQNYFDFRLERDNKVYRVESKSLWGTDTTKARLIHTKSREGDGGGGKNSQREDRQVWNTSSCRFADQDIFAVAMWLRSGKVDDFVFALSAPNTEDQYGLPCVEKHPVHVTQNPPISEPPTNPWTSDLDEACRRVDAYRTKKQRSSHPKTVVAIEDTVPKIQ